MPVVDSKTEALKTAIPGIFPSCAVTRAQDMAGRDEREVENGDIDVGDTIFRDLSESMNSQTGDDKTVFSQPVLIAAQQSAADLKGLYHVALTAEEAEKVSQCYYIKSGVLMRKWCPPGRPADEDWVAVDQIVVPPQYGAEILSRVLIDCVGPLPKTKAGYQYLLTVLDSTTRFPEAFPLRNIKAKTVIDALLVFFTRYGLPQDIQSDRGSNFTSSVFQEVMNQLGIRQVNSSPYNPQSQGALERYHQTLKTMIKSYCSENSGDWEKGIPFLLFASRDTPNESTGFTPFELVFGHEPRGPLKVVKEHMLSEFEVESGNVLDYVSQFRERLLRACELAGEQLRLSQGAMKARADKKAEPRSFEPGSKVLVLLPIQGEPLRAKFSGPYVVEKNLGKETYLVSTPDRRKTKRVCHINMLKKYYDRDEVATVAVVCEKAAEHIPGELEIPVEAEIGEGMSGKRELYT
nr:protein NYNRIN-like [Lytechinus pictus]